MTQAHVMKICSISVKSFKNSFPVKHNIENINQKWTNWTLMQFYRPEFSSLSEGKGKRKEGGEN